MYVPANIYGTFPPDRACAVPKTASRRKACGHPPTQAQCTALGCCWDASFQSQPCFKPAGGAPEQFHNDQDFFIVANEGDPLTEWVNQGDWGPDDKCNVTGTVGARLPWPHNFTTASDGGRSKPGQINNNAAGLLLPDRKTLVQMQPLYRCAPGSPILAKWGDQRGCPQTFPNVTDITGDGALGAHGGSGLSAVGGTIRLGELLPDAPPVPHALKLELYAHQYYYGGRQLNPPTAANGGRTQYRWPATGSDSYTWQPVAGYNGSLSSLVPGALLAIPPSVAPSVHTTTVLGGKFKQVLLDYGGYIVDDTASDSAAICMEAAVNEELRVAYNVSMAYPGGLGPGHALYSDLVSIFQALAVVDNNGPASIGGGGAPRRPPAAPLCL